MPELPEVETVRRALAPLLEGRRVEELQIHDPRLVRPRDPADLSARAATRTITAVQRRGKYLLVRLDGGDALVHHLRMTGAFLAGKKAQEPHIRARYRLDDGTTVSYRDVRRFGTLEYVAADTLDVWIAARLGPEPLDDAWSAADLRGSLRGSRQLLKAALLNQHIVAGIGNIYADEALHAAGIRPTRLAGSLSVAEAAALHRAVRAVLAAGIAAGSLSVAEAAALHRAVRAVLAAGIARGGSTLRDYTRPDGSGGSMQDEFRVYGRAGEPCVGCRAPLTGTKIAGRATVFCRFCQARKRR